MEMNLSLAVEIYIPHNLHLLLKSLSAEEKNVRFPQLKTKNRVKDAIELLKLG